MPREDFGEILRRLRNEKHISQEALGKHLGVGKTAICNYESGVVMPGSDKLVTLANLFGVSIDYMLGRTDRQGVPYEGYGHFKEDGEAYAIIAQTLLYEEIVSHDMLQNEAVGFVNVPRELAGYSDCFALRVQDDGLSQRGINAGDTLFISKQDTAENGDVALVFAEGEGALIGFVDGGKISPQCVLNDENVHVMGKVLYALVRV